VVYLVEMVCLLALVAVPFAQGDVAVDGDGGRGVAVEAHHKPLLLAPAEHPGHTPCTA
jgi:hypothetical protein